ncbi:MAG TPA: Rid family detoxifying hydrolase [Steroidobacteraceae bacterium]|nr:Rid family detoxifying hydrolase [Steroidobacteraceae bacterium]
MPHSSRIAWLCSPSACALLWLSGCSAPSAVPPASRFYPSAIPNAPFSAAVRAGDVVYLSGQIGLKPDGTLPAEFDEQARQAMSNVSSVLQEAGLSYDDVVKCTVMLADMTRWEDFNRIYVGYFKRERLPARSALGANGLAKGALLELECLARARAGS